ncbi:MAG: tyrosine-type recombinase/integrase [Phycisphaerae bacterium]
MARTARKYRKKPSKPYPSFPLTAHNNGQWCKKIRGKVHFFGTWDDPQAALDRYLRVAEDLHAGQQPSKSKLSGDEPRVKHICNEYLTYQAGKAERNDIRARTFAEYRNVIESFAAFVGPTRAISALTPNDFQQFRNKIAQKGLTGKGKGLGVHALSRNITMLRSMFRYAYDMDLIDRPVKFGRAFEKPSLSQRRRNRQLAEQENGKRLFTPAQIRTLLEAANRPLRTMILLGINGGFGNTDCARLPISAIDFAQNLVDFSRTKTGLLRIVPLWPQTSEDLRESLKTRPKPATKEAERRVFLTAFGNPWLREKIHRRPDGKIEKVVCVDAIVTKFDKLLRKLGMKRKGLGFYALRHTFRTWADEVNDQHAIHRIMGHVIPGMSGIYVQEIGLDRLRRVVDHVRWKLFEASDE